METRTTKAFITGISGQDGSYLTDFLLSKGYEVHGLIRRSSTMMPERLNHLYPDGISQRDGLFLHYGDITDGSTLARLINEIQPDEVYNLAAQSHVGLSFEMPLYTNEVTALGTLRVLEAIQASKRPIKFYQASSSEMFGNTPPPQNEKTPFSPASPYAVAKLAGFHFTKTQRESYGAFACNGILFNHESPRRGENFVTRKITTGVAEILAGKREALVLGNLDARRDWGYAPEYCEAMWRMLQQNQPDDYVIATGESHSVREFLEEAFGLAGMSGWQKYVRVDAEFMRPNEVHHLVGDASKAAEAFGWRPKVKFKELVKIMLEADCKRLGVLLPRA
ncbi:MAG: GDP-mannose 4,6-dehydratase [Candidatus Sungbacteria bacterium]|nr:GDP-mannose 4,6-dehydratase [Candidatus Sungbacteria bacterium]